MATAEQYAQWIVSNQDKKGTPEFDTVARAYQEAKALGSNVRSRAGLRDVYSAQTQAIPAPERESMGALDMLGAVNPVVGTMQDFNESRYGRIMQERVAQLGRGGAETLRSVDDLSDKFIPEGVKRGARAAFSPVQSAIEAASGFDPREAISTAADVTDEQIAEWSGAERLATWEDVKASPSGRALMKNLGNYILETGAQSVVDMAALISGAPGVAAYIGARTGEIASERAAADGRDSVSESDLLVGATAASVVSAIDKFGIGNLGKSLQGKLPKELSKRLNMLGRITTRTSAAGLSELTTEAVQESIEYIAETYGTEAGFVAEQMFDRALAGAVAGGGMGAAIGGAGAVSQEAAAVNARRQEQRQRDAQNADLRRTFNVGNMEAEAQAVNARTAEPQRESTAIPDEMLSGMPDEDLDIDTGVEQALPTDTRPTEYDNAGQVQETMRMFERAIMNGDDAITQQTFNQLQELGVPIQDIMKVSERAKREYDRIQDRLGPDSEEVQTARAQGAIPTEEPSLVEDAEQRAQQAKVDRAVATAKAAPPTETSAPKPVAETPTEPEPEPEAEKQVPEIAQAARKKFQFVDDARKRKTGGAPKMEREAMQDAWKDLRDALPEMRKQGYDTAELEKLLVKFATDEEFTNFNEEGMQELLKARGKNPLLKRKLKGKKWTTLFNDFLADLDTTLDTMESTREVPEREAAITEAVAQVTEEAAEETAAKQSWQNYTAKDGTGGFDNPGAYTKFIKEFGEAELENLSEYFPDNKGTGKRKTRPSRITARDVDKKKREITKQQKSQQAEGEDAQTAGISDSSVEGKKRQQAKTKVADEVTAEVTGEEATFEDVPYDDEGEVVELEDMADIAARAAEETSQGQVQDLEALAETAIASTENKFIDDEITLNDLLSHAENPTKRSKASNEIARKVGYRKEMGDYMPITRENIEQLEEALRERMPEANFSEEEINRLVDSLYSALENAKEPEELVQEEQMRQAGVEVEEPSTAAFVQEGEYIGLAAKYAPELAPLTEEEKAKALEELVPLFVERNNRQPTEIEIARMINFAEKKIQQRRIRRSGRVSPSRVGKGREYKYRVTDKQVREATAERARQEAKDRARPSWPFADDKAQELFKEEEKRWKLKQSDLPSNRQGRWTRKDIRDAVSKRRREGRLKTLKIRQQQAEQERAEERARVEEARAEQRKQLGRFDTKVAKDLAAYFGIAPESIKGKNISTSDVFAASPYDTVNTFILALENGYTPIDFPDPDNVAYEQVMEKANELQRMRDRQADLRAQAMDVMARKRLEEANKARRILGMEELVDPYKVAESEAEEIRLRDAAAARVIEDFYNRVDPNLPEEGVMRIRDAKTGELREMTDDEIADSNRKLKNLKQRVRRQKKRRAETFKPVAEIKPSPAKRQKADVLSVREYADAKGVSYDEIDTLKTGRLSYKDVDDYIAKLEAEASIEAMRGRRAAIEAEREGPSLSEQAQTEYEQRQEARQRDLEAQRAAIITAELAKGKIAPELVEEEKAAAREAVKKHEFTTTELEEAPVDMQPTTNPVDVLVQRKSVAKALADTLAQDSGGIHDLGTWMQFVKEQLHKDDPYVALINALTQKGQTFNDVHLAYADEGEGPVANWRAYTVDGKRNSLVSINREILESGQGMHAFMHEAIHAATALAIHKNNSYAQEMNDIVKYVREYAADNLSVPEMNTLANAALAPEEFVAELYTNHKVQRVLASIPARDKQSSVLVEIFKKIAQFLGIPQEWSVLAEAMGVADNLIMTDQQNRQALNDYEQIKDLFYFRKTDSDRILNMPGTGSARIRNFQASRRVAETGLTEVAEAVRNVANTSALHNSLQKVKKFGIRYLRNKDELIHGYKKYFKTRDTNYMHNYDVTSNVMTSLARSWQQKAERINLMWREYEQKYPDKGAALAELMHDATFYRLHPELKFYDKGQKHKHHWGNSGRPVTTGEARMQQKHAELQRRYKDLGQEGRQIYKLVEKFHADMWNENRRAAMHHLVHSYDVLVNDLTDQQLNDLINAPDVETAANIIDTSKLSKDGKRGLKVSVKDILDAAKISGPYFPLRRYGQYVVEGVKRNEQTFLNKADAHRAKRAYEAQGPGFNGTLREGPADSLVLTTEEKVFEAFDSHVDADQRAVQLMNDGYTRADGDANITRTKREEWGGRESGVSASVNSFLSGIESNLDRLGAHDQTGRIKETANKAIMRAYSNMMMESSIAKSRLRRNNVAGASMEMRRAFAERAYAGSWSIADMRYGLEKARHLQQMQEMARYVGDPDKNEAMVNVIEELVYRDSVDLEQRRVSNMDRILSSVGFAAYLASPHYSLVNATQPWLVTQPYLAAKYGQAAAAKELGKSYENVFESGIEELKRINAGFNITREGPELMLEKVLNKVSQNERDMLKTLERLGIIDASLMQELFRTAKGQQVEGKSKPGKAWVNTTNFIMGSARAMPQVVEIMNRVVTARATYALERKRLLDAGTSEADAHVLATFAARDAVQKTQFNYTDENKPPMWRKPGFRSAMMFRMYMQGLSSLFFTNTYAALMNDPDLSNASNAAKKREARKMIGALMLNHGLAAGMVGGLAAPPLAIMYFAAQTVARALGDDEPWDIQQTMHEFMNDTARDFLGEQAGGFVATTASRGLPWALGMDIQGNVGLNNLFNLTTVQYGAKSADQGLKDLAFSFFGPIGGLASRMLRGIDYVQNGQLWKGMEYMVPHKFGQNLAKSVRMYSEGATDYRGNEIEGGFDEWDSVIRAVGFPSDREALMYQGRTAGRKHDTYVNNLRTQLMQRYRVADWQDRRDVMNDIRRFNMKYPEDIITSDSLQRSLVEKRRREFETRHGVYTERLEARRRASVWDMP